MRLSTLFLFFVLVLCIVLAFPSCRISKTIWGLSEHDLLDNITGGRLEFLDLLDPAGIDPLEIDRIDPSLRYSLAFAAQMRGLEMLSVKLLTSAAQSGPLRLEASLKLCEYLEGMGDPENLEKCAREASALFPEEAEFRDAYIRALMEGNEYERALRAMTEFRGAGYDEEIWFFYHIECSYALWNPDWKAELKDLIMKRPASPAHARVLDFLGTRGLLDQSGETFMTLLAAKAAFSEGEYKTALDAFLLLPVSFLRNTYYGLKELFNSFARAGRSGKGIEFIKLHASDSDDPGITYIFTFMQGYFLWLQEKYPAAVPYFKKAVDFAPDFELQRTLWYWFDSAARSDAANITGILPDITGLWSDPAYFSDSIDRLVAGLAGASAWDLIGSLFEVFSGKMDDYTLSMFAGIKLLAERGGYLEISTVEKSDLRLFLKRQNVWSYYKILGLLLLGEDLRSVFFEERQALHSYQELSPAEIALGSLLAVGLPDQAYKQAREMGGRISSDYLAYLAGKLNTLGFIEFGVRLIDRAMDGPAFSRSHSDYLVHYPRPFREFVETAADEFGLNRAVLYALMRQESYFNPSAVSRSGAVGLTQIMPGTAGEISKRIGLKDPALTDPAINLRMGAFYIAGQLSRCDNLAEAFCAYNAGYGNLTAWKKVYPDIRPELFIEAVPFTETRNYVKKVFAAAVFYVLLYDMADPLELTERFFPGIADGGGIE